MQECKCNQEQMSEDQNTKVDQLKSSKQRKGNGKWRGVCECEKQRGSAASACAHFLTG